MMHGMWRDKRVLAELNENGSYAIIIQGGLEITVPLYEVTLLTKSILDEVVKAHSRCYEISFEDTLCG